MQTCWSWLQRLTRGTVSPRERCPVCPIPPSEDARLVQELAGTVANITRRCKRNPAPGPLAIPVRLEYWQDVPGQWDDRLYACEPKASVAYYPGFHMVVVHGMLMGVSRAWCLSCKNETGMTSIFREIMVCTSSDARRRHRISRRVYNQSRCIWFYLNVDDGKDHSRKELGYWISPWYLQGRGMAFIPWLVRGLQRWTRRCLQRKRRQRVLDALEQARAHGQPNWLDSLPLDLLTRGVLARL